MSRRGLPTCLLFHHPEHLPWVSSLLWIMSFVATPGGHALRNILRTSDGLDTVRECVTLLERGGVVAVPTDTIYGLTASALDTQAIEKIYSIKGRTKMRPLAICVGNIDDIDKWEMIIHVYCSLFWWKGILVMSLPERERERKGLGKLLQRMCSNWKVITVLEWFLISMCGWPCPLCHPTSFH